MPEGSSAITDAVFRPVRTGNAFEETVERLLDGIRLGVHSRGDRLPPERELAGRLGVSRVTVRDALRELAAAGYVETRSRGAIINTASFVAVMGGGHIPDLLHGLQGRRARAQP